MIVVTVVNQNATTGKETPVDFTFDEELVQQEVTIHGNLTADELRCHLNWGTLEREARALAYNRLHIELPAGSLLEQAANLYRINVRLKVRNPNEYIAKRLGVSVVCARSLVYRARKKGLLEPAKGPVPGWVGSDDD